MDRSYKFSIIRLQPRDARDERINIGLAVFTKDSIDVRASRRLEKVRVISPAIDDDALRSLINNLSVVDEQIRSLPNITSAKRIEMLSEIGPISLSDPGILVAGSHDEYEERIRSILKSIVEPEFVPPKLRLKRTKLLTQVKQVLKTEKVLARKGEGLSSRRIVTSLEIDQGLVADLALKNGAMHVIETVDAGHDATLRRIIADIGVAALVLERARMKFDFGNHTTTRLIYSASAAFEDLVKPSLDAAQHQGAELYNWASSEDQKKLVRTLTLLATPLTRRSSKHSVRFN